MSREFLLEMLGLGAILILFYRFRRDKSNFRPRINKLESQLDQEQKLSGNYFFLEGNVFVTPNYRIFITHNSDTDRLIVIFRRWWGKFLLGFSSEY